MCSLSLFYGFFKECHEFPAHPSSLRDTKPSLDKELAATILFSA